MLRVFRFWNVRFFGVFNFLLNIRCSSCFGVFLLFMDNFLFFFKLFGVN